MRIPTKAWMNVSQSHWYAISTSMCLHLSGAKITHDAKDIDTILYRVQHILKLSILNVKLMFRKRHYVSFGLEEKALLFH